MSVMRHIPDENRIRIMLAIDLPENRLTQRIERFIEVDADAGLSLRIRAWIWIGLTIVSWAPIISVIALLM